jgi:peroxiredoxin
VGATIPAFEVIDLNGNPQTLGTLTGPNGLLLVFFRSADW